MIPIKTTLDDLEKLTTYLRPNFGWVSLTKVKSNLERVSDNRKIEAARWLGLIKRDGQNVEITDVGRAWASTQDSAAKAKLLAGVLAAAPLYVQTVEWMHHAKKADPTKTDVGDQWYKHYTDLLEGAQGAALGDGVIMFMRFAEGAGLGKFITAGKNRPETYFKSDLAAIEQFYAEHILKQAHSGDQEPDTGDSGGVVETHAGVTGSTREVTLPVATQASHVAPQVRVQTSPAIHVNLEIHIAADATAETVAEIFKNMRKYVLNDGTAEVADSE